MKEKEIKKEKKKYFSITWNQKKRESENCQQKRINWITHVESFKSEETSLKQTPSSLLLVSLWYSQLIRTCTVWYIHTLSLKSDQPGLEYVQHQQRAKRIASLSPHAARRCYSEGHKAASQMPRAFTGWPDLPGCGAERITRGHYLSPACDSCCISETRNGRLRKKCVLSAPSWTETLQCA